jgi:Xaa-Pro aminopeptidase
MLDVDFGCICQHYFSDSGRTLAVGDLCQPLSDRYTALRACIDRGAEVMRPGLQASSVRDAMWNRLTESGVEASYPHGHGLGLEPRDYPIIVAPNRLRIKDDCLDVSSDLPLEAGMVINLEAAIFAPPCASLNIEKTFLITEGASEPLIAQDREHPFQILC